MIRGFTFERALGWPFTAPHVGSFPWIFGAAYAAAFSIVLAIIGWFASADIAAWVSMVEGVSGSEDPEVVMGVMGNLLARFLPWGILSAVASWVVWAMFETASQRRYIWGEGFSLGFGGDEVRMMVVGLLWAILGFLLIGLPLLLSVGPTMFAAFTDAESLNGVQAGERVAVRFFGGFAALLFTFPLYAFLATRLAPCFGLTLKEKRIRFFDAWNVSRGRFWPILGAYLVLSICGGMIGQVISGIAQLIMIPAMSGFSGSAESAEDIRALIFSPQFFIPLAIYLFIVMALQGILQHVVGGPAAFAVRHDPRGGVEAQAQVGAFE